MTAHRSSPEWRGGSVARADGTILPAVATAHPSTGFAGPSFRSGEDCRALALPTAFTAERTALA